MNTLNGLITLINLRVGGWGGSCGPQINLLRNRRRLPHNLQAAMRAAEGWPAPDLAS